VGQERETRTEEKTATAEFILRALSSDEPGGARWRADFQRLQASAGQSEESDALMIAGLLRLARAQQNCLPEYLSLVDTCLRLHCYEPPVLDAIWWDLRIAYPFLRERIVSDRSPLVRSAAARLLSCFADCSGLNQAAIEWALRLERDERTVASMISSLHSLRREDPRWPGTLEQFQSKLNPSCVRFQAACCRLDSECAAAPDVIAELASQLYGEDGQAVPSLRAIALYGARLPRQAGVLLWSGLLAAVEEFDGAAEVGCHLMRSLTGDRREGWGQVRLTSRTLTGETAPLPGVMTAVVRLAVAGVFRKITGRKLFLPLPAGHVPAREYPEVRAFPPALDYADPLVRQVLGALAECDPLWSGRTDLWRLFGLPDRRLELRLLLDR
jgi:hypothetical protein